VVIETAQKLIPASVQAPLVQLIRRKRLRDVNRIIARGLPPHLCDAVRFIATKDPPAYARHVYEKVESLRHALRQRADESVLFPNGTTRPLNEVASQVSISPFYGLALHLVSRALPAESCLELGVGGGIGSCYLALTPTCRRYVGVDLAPQALALGRQHLLSCVDESRIELIETSFDDALARFQRESRIFDFVWLDGDHYTETTIRYVESIIPCLRPGSIIGFDDIRWTSGMYKAWEVIREWPGFSNSFDLGRIGMASWSGNGETPRRWDLAQALLWPWRPNEGAALPAAGYRPTM
jgi:predicted O-methyltransferase YrrM